MTPGRMTPGLTPGRSRHVCAFFSLVPSFFCPPKIFTILVVDLTFESYYIFSQQISLMWWTDQSPITVWKHTSLRRHPSPSVHLFLHHDVTSPFCMDARILLAFSTSNMQQTIYIWPFTVLMTITSKLSSCRPRHVEWKNALQRRSQNGRPVSRKDRQRKVRLLMKAIPKTIMMTISMMTMTISMMVITILNTILTMNRTTIPPSPPPKAKQRRIGKTSPTRRRRKSRRRCLTCRIWSSQQNCL